MKSRDRKILRLIKIQIALLLLLIAGVTYYYVSGYAKTVSDLKTEANLLVRKSNPNTFRQTETSEVYDINGDTISVLKGEKDVYYITYEQIPEDAVKALISIEDKKFFSHDGVDYKERMSEIHSELKSLQNDSDKLMRDILKNWESVK